MSTKFFFGLFMIFLLGGFGFISGVMTSGSFQVSTGGNKVIIISGLCQEDWSGSGYGACVNGIQTFICFDRNNCNTTNLKPALCGTTQTCTVQQNSGGGGGGGGGGSGSGSNGVIPLSTTTSSSNNPNICIEQWDCASWSNSNGNCGTRTCNDLNKCGTILLEPITEKACSGLTGSVINGLSQFVATPAGITSVIFTVLVLFGVVITLSRKKMNSIKKESKPIQ